MVSRRIGGLVDRRIGRLVSRRVGWLLSGLGGRGLYDCAQERGARCSTLGLDQIKLIEPNWVFKSRCLGLFQLKDKPVTMLDIEIGVNLLQLSLILFGGIRMRSMYSFVSLKFALYS